MSLYTVLKAIFMIGTPALLIVSGCSLYRVSELESHQEFKGCIGLLCSLWGMLWTLLVFGMYGVIPL